MKYHSERSKTVMTLVNRSFRLFSVYLCLNVERRTEPVLECGPRLFYIRYIARKHDTCMRWKSLIMSVLRCESI